MTRAIVYTMLALVFLAPIIEPSDKTISDAPFTIDGVTYRAAEFSGRLVITTDYERSIVRLDDCTDFSSHQFCLEAIDVDPVDYWPENFSANITYIANCEDCTFLGQACEVNVTCVGVCVHDVCLPEDPWCGDGYCDAGESCEEDCLAAVVEEEPEPVVEEPVVEPEPEPVVEEQVEEVLPETISDDDAATLAPMNPAPPEVLAEGARAPNYWGAGLSAGFAIVLITLLFVRARMRSHRETI